jgi:hypothetical protein
MPSYPSENLRRALKEAGVDYAEQDRISLRGLLEERVGTPPPEHCTADELAKMVLTLSDPDPPPSGAGVPKSPAQ